MVVSSYSGGSGLRRGESSCRGCYITISICFGGFLVQRWWWTSQSRSEFLPLLFVFRDFHFFNMKGGGVELQNTLNSLSSLGGVKTLRQVDRIFLVPIIVGIVVFVTGVLSVVNVVVGVAGTILLSNVWVKQQCIVGW